MQALAEDAARTLADASAQLTYAVSGSLIFGQIYK